MARISVTLNQKEESMVDFLEDIADRQAIAEYEAEEKSGGVKFIDSAEVLSMLRGGL